MDNDNNRLANRAHWTSTFGFIMAAAGSAVGLGNLWKFPYLVGQNGGSAFIIIYALLLVFIGVPLVIAEITIGRFGQLNPVGSYGLISPKLKWVGALGLVTGFILLSFYPVVGGWILYYLYHSFVSFGSNPDYAKIFTEYTSNPYLPCITLLVFSLMNYIIVALGVEKGIEKYSKIMMPALLVILVIVGIRTLTLPKALQGVRFIFQPDFSKVTGKTILDAVGQVFFSLSLGMGALMTYGSYLSKKDNLFKSSISIPFIDTIVALLATIAIMPAVFAFGFEPKAGPSLIFITLPAVFDKMPMGFFISIIFFTLMLFAALTSSISMLEGLVSYLTDKGKMKRFGATTLISIIIFLLGIPCSLSFGLLSHINILPGKSIFDSMDFLASNILLPFGGIMLAVCVGWIWDGGLRYETIIVRNQKGGPDVVTNGYVFNSCLREITNQGTLNFPFMSAWIFIIKWVAPLVVLAIFIDSCDLLSYLEGLLGIK
ncbi:MAG: sodium-dependent transporter [Candidatus Riflebacteria bacterium]|nr:sodium-dependent transporter [Candidatus Riflebacteria bacterium]